MKVFKAGLYFRERLSVDGDIPVHLVLAEAGQEYGEQIAEARRRSQTETKSIFWVAQIDEAIDRETVELFRSREILSRRERVAQTRDETALVAEEKRRLGRQQDKLRRLLRQSLLTGAIFFRGNDRSPDDTATDVGPTASDVLAQALPEVFDRYEEAAARVSRKDLDSLMTTENLRGLTSVFTDLKLVRDQGGRPVFNTESGPLAEVLSRIENRTSYGEVANGRYLTDEFAKEPFGWEFDVTRLFVIAILRAGKLEATSKGQIIESALSIDARNTFTNNNLFRQASFRLKTGLEFTDIVDASERFREVFGREIPELQQGVVANAIREEIHRHDEYLHEVYTTLVEHGLPGTEILRSALDQMRSIRAGDEDQIIMTFNGAYKELKEAIKRGAELTQILTETQTVQPRTRPQNTRCNLDSPQGRARRYGRGLQTRRDARRPDGEGDLLPRTARHRPVRSRPCAGTRSASRRGGPTTRHRLRRGNQGVEGHARLGISRRRAAGTRRPGTGVPGNYQWNRIHDNSTSAVGPRRVLGPTPGCGGKDAPLS